MRLLDGMEFPAEITIIVGINFIAKRPVCVFLAMLPVTTHIVTSVQCVIRSAPILNHKSALALPNLRMSVMDAGKLENAISKSVCISQPLRRKNTVLRLLKVVPAFRSLKMSSLL